MSKICKECKTNKPNYKYVGTKDVCHLCYNEKNHDVLITNNINARATRLKNKYNLTIKQYDRLLKDQYCRCAICEQVQTDLTRRLCVDHCHDSGEVRALLCTTCNTALGLTKEDPRILLNMIAYIERFSYLKNKSK